MNQLTENTHCCCSKPATTAPPQALLTTTKKTGKSIPAILLSIFIAFFPKCPLCWAVYMSMFSSIGLARLPYMKWLLPVMMLFLAVHLFLIYRKARQQGYLPFYVSLAGSAILFLGRTWFPATQWLLLAGIVCIIGGSLLHNFSRNNVTLTSNQ
ncbi:hypothetical protein SAMN05421788_107273 [Filimonas lacunae]|uniref:MerC mercury resistance protein n=1 Tax=Filimonas lacunae TaxID=477680 RepID=A0A173MG60_9BACT|nr:hypothetical protein [Filimonas lacunae]BAV06612.1 hypothetical protein FLA_2631 [Filimonas lacunae]SIT27582.1 hypothetical protein SAMN05421788_107273 [Filimonas lacunae]